MGDFYASNRLQLGNYVVRLSLCEPVAAEHKVPRLIPVAGLSVQFLKIIDIQPEEVAQAKVELGLSIISVETLAERPLPLL